MNQVGGTAVRAGARGDQRHVLHGPRASACAAAPGCEVRTRRTRSIQEETYLGMASNLEAMASTYQRWENFCSFSANLDNRNIPDQKGFSRITCGFSTRNFVNFVTFKRQGYDLSFDMVQCTARNKDATRGSWPYY